MQAVDQPKTSNAGAHHSSNKIVSRQQVSRAPRISTKETKAVVHKRINLKTPTAPQTRINKLRKIVANKTQCLPEMRELLVPNQPQSIKAA